MNVRAIIRYEYRGRREGKGKKGGRPPARVDFPLIHSFLIDYRNSAVLSIKLHHPRFV